MITVTALDELGRDERGATFVFDTDRRGPFLVAYRRAGTISGNHYHSGKSSNKDPEELVLMSGTIRVSWRATSHAHAAGDESGATEVSGPARITIPAGWWHEVLGLTDFVMLELNGPADGQGDTFRLDGSKVY